MTGLRSQRSFGLVKLQSLVVFMILVLQVAVNELVDCSSPPREYEWPAIQWACRPFLIDAEAEIHPLQERTRNLCLKLRGGRLGGGSGGKGQQGGSSAVLGAPINNNKNVTEGRSIVVDKSISDNDDNETLSALLLSAVDYGDDESVSSSDDSTASELPFRSEFVAAAAPPKAVLDAYTFSFFKEKDGSESDPDGIPRRYMKMQNNKRDAAKKAMEATLAWRDEHDVNTILARPHPTFDVCKKVFPHYFCGRDNTNHVILLQRPGLIDLHMAKANGLTGEMLLFHYVYEMEYLWHIIEPHPDATMTSVVDLTGLNISVLRRTDLMRVVNLFVTTMDAHFPLRSHRTLLINAPKWFGAIYKLISPLLRESTKQKIQILSKGKKQEEVLQKLMADCPVPTGKNKLDEIPSSEMETEMRNFVSVADPVHTGIL